MPAASSDIQLKIARIAPAVLLVAGLSVMFWLYRSLGTEGLISLQESLNPVLFFSSLAVLITFGMPATPFILLASSIFSAPVAALGCGLTLLAHLLLTWWLAHGVLRRYIQRLVAKFQKKAFD
ncbi:MAG: hypothetical protein LR015_14900 [Verrucomicrobia bacterium]|nr:hypothetical protein [Verrucomicrobiota bacterium]